MGRNITSEYHSWMAVDTATNDVATATRAAVSGLQHYITGIYGSFSASASAKQMTLKEGSTELGRWYIYDNAGITFESPIKLDPSTAANLTLAAGGSTIVGAAVITGYTL